PMKTPLLLLLVAACAARPAAALDPSTAITQFGHDIWQSEQGLPQNTIYAVAQTRDGYLWLATAEGLARFDGVSFTVFSKQNTPAIRNNVISALLQTKDGALWIGMDGGGLARLRDGVFQPFGLQDGLSSLRISTLCEDGAGTLWAGTFEAGLNRLEKGGFVALGMKQGLSDDRIRAIADDGKGTLWIGTDGGGLNRLTDGRLTPFSTAQGLSSNQVRALAFDRQGHLWVGTFGGGLNEIVDGRVRILTTANGLASNAVWALREDRDGSLWIGTYGGGLNRLNGTRLETFGAKEGLSNEYVWSILEDREGSLWIGTLAGGLNRLRQGKFTCFTTKEGLAADGVRAITQDPTGAMWIGTEGGGLSRLAEGRFTTYTTKNGLLDNGIYSVLSDERSLWIGSYGAGLNRMRGGHIATFKPPAGTLKSVHVLAFEGPDALWVGTFRDGLYLFTAAPDSGNGRELHGELTPFTTKQGLSNDKVLTVRKSRSGIVWVGTAGGGLNRLEGGKFTDFPGRQALEKQFVYAVHEDADGVLWIGTGGGGLGRIGPSGYSAMTVRDGLFDDVVFGIVEDDGGDLWFTCNKGISRVKRAQLNAFAERKAASISSIAYGVADGMKSRECNSGGQPGWKSRDGRLWFPTVRGFAVIDPARIETNTNVPPVLLESVLSSGVEAASSTFPPGSEKFEFHYTALSFLGTDRVRFRYRLDGLDTTWTDAGTRRVAYYNRIPHGTYTFQVVACNSDGLWNERGASYPLVVKPHGYQTWWFRLLAVIGVVLAATAGLRARVRQLQAREVALLRVVELRTGELRKEKENAEALTEELKVAQERISRLLESSPGASESLAAWSRSVADEVAGIIGAGRIGIWEIGNEGLSPLSDEGLPPPSLDALHEILGHPGRVVSESKDGILVPLTGLSGELCGALLIPGRSQALHESERRLVVGFAHQLGGALEVSRIRRQLAAAQERRITSRRELHERGIATLQICPTCGLCYDHTVETCATDGVVLESPRPLPFILLDRYRFLRVLGQGGMGMVLAAHDEKLGRDVAIKLIRPDHFGNVEMRHRFEREARTLAHIQHPGVIALYDSGELEDGTAFIVTEKLSGCDLSLLLETFGPGRPSQVAALLEQGAAALRAAHLAGVVHRDIKPGNIFLVDVDTLNGFRIKILDFGLAKSMTLEQGLTQSGMVVGTPCYMSPEQVQGAEVDSRADVYSFAAVCYEALTGRRAVPGDDMGRVLINALSTKPLPVSSRLRGTPIEVDQAFESALAKDAARRLKDIELWATSFADVLRRMPEDVKVSGWPEAPNSFQLVGEGRPMSTIPVQKMPAD
ncbi:MAG: two-component regulator propeller domain-containing protein, partial [Thermoanaerobaculia bacterium]